MQILIRRREIKSHLWLGVEKDYDLKNALPSGFISFLQWWSCDFIVRSMKRFNILFTGRLSWTFDKKYDIKKMMILESKVDSELSMVGCPADCGGVVGIQPLRSGLVGMETRGCCWLLASYWAIPGTQLSANLHYSHHEGI